MAETPIIFDDVEVLEADGLGFTCRIGNDRVFIGKYVPVDGTAVRFAGDRGRLALPRWFVEQEGLPLARHMSDVEVEQWFLMLQFRLSAAREVAAREPNNPEAQARLRRAEVEMEAAAAIRAQRHHTKYAR